MLAIYATALKLFNPTVNKLKTQEPPSTPKIVIYQCC